MLYRHDEERISGMSGKLKYIVYGIAFGLPFVLIPLFIYLNQPPSAGPVVRIDLRNSEVSDVE